MDKVEWKCISPYEQGEPWAKQLDCKDEKGVAIYINGTELLTLAAEVEYPDNPADGLCAYGHISPQLLYCFLKTGGEAVPLACCGDCGETGCWSIRAAIKDEGETIIWDVHGERFEERVLHFAFDKNEYRRQLTSLCSMAEKYTENAYKGLFWCKGNDDFITVKIPCSFTGNVPIDYRWATSAISKSGDNYTHKDAWRMLDESITEGHPYHYYPRGRVEIKNGKATVYCHLSLVDAAHIAAVKKEFRLNHHHGIAQVSVKADGSRHYEAEV